MKGVSTMKIKLTSFLFILIWMLTACSPNIPAGTTETGNSAKPPVGEDAGKDGTLYADVNGIIYKYNIQNGYATPLCGDPLCKHNDSNCPFYGIGEDFYLINDTILYYRGNEIFEYDTKTSQITKLGVADGQIFFMTLMQNRLYYNAVNFDFAPNAEHNTQVNLYYLKLSDNQIVKINTEPLYETQQLTGIENERLIWYDTGLWTYYTSDFEYRDIKPSEGEQYGIHTGDHAHRLEVSSVSPTSFNLYNTVDGEKNIILHDIVSVKGYKDSLIVTYNNKTGKYIGNTLSADGEEIPVYEYQGTSLYKYDSEGQNGILLCTLPDDCIIDSLAPSDSAMSSGNYIGIPLREYVFDSRGYITGYQNTKNIAIVNYVTGEYIITQSS